MGARIITGELLEAFCMYLTESEKSEATIEKYMRDTRRFAAYAGGRTLTRQILLDWKREIGSRYAAASANSMLAAVNALLRFAGWLDLCVRQLRMQRKAYLPEEKELSREEYERLVRTAKERGNERLCLILQTICATGMRVSELPYVTVEAARQGEAVVRLKGKTRTVLLVRVLRDMLLCYAKKRGIASGPVFITRRNRPVSRSAIWRDMKALCRSAGVAEGKVFPHNLRHLFARTFYGIERDIAKLADILGHSSINTTRIYIATTGAEHRRQMERLGLIPGQKKNRRPRTAALST
ncbi:MAG: tyrosine-type recombinase/integrase [Clostridia bacterium]|nr:tyrosine-type recombinase/integrase [Clostridia bacterium]